MSLKEHYYKVSYCGRDSRFRLFPAQFRMYAANASIPILMTTTGKTVT